MLLAAAATPTLSSAAEAANCIVVCPAKDCVRSGKKEGIEPKKRTLVANCPQMEALSAPVEGLYQTAKGPERFRITKTGTAFGSLVPGLLKATCMIGQACLEERDASRLAVKGGMGADEDTLVRQGRPCEAGLPCGQVLFPRERLVIDVPAVPSGQLILKAKRGGGAGAAAFAGRDGRIEVPAAALSPGAVYAYTLQGAPGSAPLSGEFALLSSKMQRDIEQAIDEARRTDPEGAALGEIEILIEEKLQWDATQRLR